ncbi:energy transducer TonB [Candidatus Tisiphia endosymbiont of Ptychoptera albimana]|jgi:outer membrane biosynthesis protein TonB|uniref:energy transducer TonB n=1 Tax=Candidatus Tisiphia endosymbiont of Ptychoptera albimana TaxID=3066260 RepID=UPI001DF542A2|nr:energy transducer TonB [Rickettsia endosymbiont of Sericostoma sp. HW-2014]
MKNNNIVSVSFICSVVLHLLIIYFFLFGLPSLFKKLPEEQVIVFEMLPISNQSNVPNKTKQPEKAIENQDAKKVEQSKPDYVEEKKPVEKAVEEKKLVEDKPVEEKKSIEEKPIIEEKKPIEKPIIEEEKPLEEKPIIEKKKAIEEKKPTEVKKPTEEKPIIEKKKAIEEKKPTEVKKPIEKKKKIPNKSDLDSLLKNLEQSSEGSNAKSNKQARAKENKETQESKGSYDDTLALSISEISLIKQQIERLWSKPIGIQNLEQLRVILYIALNKDGSVKEVKVKETICPNITKTACDALSDSAMRAVWQASPINNLDPQRYDSWKEFNFLFNPSNSNSSN